MFNFWTDFWVFLKNSSICLSNSDRCPWISDWIFAIIFLHDIIWCYLLPLNRLTLSLSSYFSKMFSLLELSSQSDGFLFWLLWRGLPLLMASYWLLSELLSPKVKYFYWISFINFVFKSFNFCVEASKAFATFYPTIFAGKTILCLTGWTCCCKNC